MFWNISPFNLPFCIVFAVCGLIVFLPAVFLRKQSRTVRAWTLAGIMIATFLFYIWYKVMLLQDTAYTAICVENGKSSNFWMELPLQLCNINMILIPIAAVTNNKPISAFAFFLAPLGAIMALLMPAIGFDGYSLFLPRIAGYYITHMIIFFAGPAMAAYGLFKPKFKDFPITIAAVLIISFIVFLISMLLRKTGLAPDANYFYSVVTEGNPILEIFHSWIPIPYLYLMPSILILLPYMTIVTGAFRLVHRLKKKEEVEAAEAAPVASAPAEEKEPVAGEKESVTVE